MEKTPAAPPAEKETSWKELQDIIESGEEAVTEWLGENSERFRLLMATQLDDLGFELEKRYRERAVELGAPGEHEGSDLAAMRDRFKEMGDGIQTVGNWDGVSEFLARTKNNRAEAITAAENYDGMDQELYAVERSVKDYLFRHGLLNNLRGETVYDELDKRLADAAGLLKSYYKTRDTDSIRQDSFRKRDYARACDLLEGLPWAAEHAKRVIQLTVGSEEIRSNTFSRNAYDFVETRSGQKLEPGQVIFLKREKKLFHLGQSYETRFSTFYMGTSRYMLEAVQIGQAIAEGGKLELVAAETEETQSE